MEKYFRITSDRLLAVEGKDEVNFFKKFMECEKIIDVQIIDIGGKDKFPTELRALRNLEDFDNVKVIGFVRDAEANKAENTFKGFCDMLNKNRLPVPNTVDCCVAGPPKIGVFIMPDNQGAGMLENLCLKTLKDQNIESCIDQYISCFESNMDQTEKVIFNFSKAKVQAYLASRAPIVNSLGLGAQKGYWDFNHACFNQVKTFLHSLFDL